MAPRTLVTHWVHPEVIEDLERFCEPVGRPGDGGVLDRGEVLSLLGGAAAVIVCMADHVDAEFIAAGPALRVVSATLKGYDNIDVAACTARGVWVTILPDMLTTASAELAVGLVIGLLRHVAPADRFVRTGAFQGWRPRFYGCTLYGGTVGILGMGKLGRAVAQRLAPFGARVLYTDPRPVPEPLERDLGARRVELPELLAVSDVVLPLLPLTDGTRHLVDAAALRAMRPGAHLVNVSRGSVVDEDAVADALEDGLLAGYAADVFAMEDWARPDRPRTVPARLLAHPRTLLTPHLGTAVDSVRRDMSLAAVGQVGQALAGRRPEFAINELRR